MMVTPVSEHAQGAFVQIACQDKVLNSHARTTSVKNGATAAPKVKPRIGELARTRGQESPLRLRRSGPKQALVDSSLHMMSACLEESS